MRQLFFWNPEDTILALKIKHFSKKYCTKSGVKKYMWASKDEKYIRLLEKIKEVEEHYNTITMKENYSLKDRKSMEKTFINTMVSDFFTRYIIPNLVEKWYFNTYIIPKKINKKTQKEILNHTDWYTTELF